MTINDRTLEKELNEVIRFRQEEFDFKYPKNPFSQKSQNHRLWEYLRIYRIITTKELHYLMHMDTARIRDLRKYGLSIECHTIPGESGNRVYRVKEGK